MPWTPPPPNGTSTGAASSTSEPPWLAQLDPQWRDIVTGAHSADKTERRVAVIDAINLAERAVHVPLGQDFFPALESFLTAKGVQDKSYRGLLRLANNVRNAVIHNGFFPDAGLAFFCASAFASVCSLAQGRVIAIPTPTELQHAQELGQPVHALHSAPMSNANNLPSRSRWWVGGITILALLLLAVLTASAATAVWMASIQSAKTKKAAPSKPLTCASAQRTQVDSADVIYIEVITASSRLGREMLNFWGGFCTEAGVYVDRNGKAVSFDDCVRGVGLYTDEVSLDSSCGAGIKGRCLRTDATNTQCRPK